MFFLLLVWPSAKLKKLYGCALRNGKAFGSVKVKSNIFHHFPYQPCTRHVPTFSSAFIHFCMQICRHHSVQEFSMNTVNTLGWILSMYPTFRMILTFPLLTTFIWRDILCVHISYWPASDSSCHLGSNWCKYYLNFTEQRPGPEKDIAMLYFYTTPYIRDLLRFVTFIILMIHKIYKRQWYFYSLKCLLKSITGYFSWNIKIRDMIDYTG